MNSLEDAKEGDTVIVQDGDKVLSLSVETCGAEFVTTRLGSFLRSGTSRWHAPGLNNPVALAPTEFLIGLAREQRRHEALAQQVVQLTAMRDLLNMSKDRLTRVIRALEEP